MPLTVKPVAAAASKFVRNGQAGSQDYAKNAEAAANKWFESTGKATDNWSGGVQDAIGRGAFAKGVQRAGAGEFARGIATKGAIRFGPGVAGSQSKYATRVQPYFDTLAALELPPKRFKGDPSNLARVTAVAQALRARKLAA